MPKIELYAVPYDVEIEDNRAIMHAPHYAKPLVPPYNSKNRYTGVWLDGRFLRVESDGTHIEFSFEDKTPVTVADVELFFRHFLSAIDELGYEVLERSPR